MHLRLVDPTIWKNLYPSSIHFQGVGFKVWFKFNWNHKSQYKSVTTSGPESIYVEQMLKYQGEATSATTNIGFMISWTNHMRCAYLDRGLKRMYIYDPWMQTLDKDGDKGFELIRKINKDNGISTEFVPHNQEQGLSEGSCAAAALMRLLLVAKYGKLGAFMTLPCYYPILVSRLISLYRVKEEQQ